MDLFSKRAPRVPLSERMRPRTLAEMVGQVQLLGPGELLRSAIESDRTPSMILWGPPGTGKTTLAKVISRETSSRFESLSAVLSGVAELRKAVAAAAQERQRGTATILFIDEIHRFNRAQQDALLPHIEAGTVTLIGATTENPSFAINAALLSRARVFRLEPLAEGDLRQLLERALSDRERGLGELRITLDEDALDWLAIRADGDARRALEALEIASEHVADSGGMSVRRQDVQRALARSTLLCDRSAEEHYNVASALIKSLRGSDPDASLYWMLRMLESGEDPRFVLRRLIIFASEDIGNADPHALALAVAADQAFQRLGMPEAMHALAQCCTYLACAPKSNAAYVAWQRAQQDVRSQGSLAVPLKLRNAPTQAMKAWGYGEGYRYPHDEDGYAAGETYLPEPLVGRRYYEPKNVGCESAFRRALTGRRRGDPAEQ